MMLSERTSLHSATVMVWTGTLSGRRLHIVAARGQTAMRSLWGAFAAYGR
jgi:hypothetical protein